MMRTISPLDLRRHLGAILDAASAGERFLVERDHKPVAMLVSVEDGQRLDEDEGERRRRSLAALDRLVAMGDEFSARGVFDGLPPNAVIIREERDRDER